MEYASGVQLSLVFIETPVFTRQARGLLSDENYRAPQFALSLRPEQGAVISGGAGLRKVRWRLRGAGKRGGARVIYYWDADDTIFMLFIYRKSHQADLTTGQLRILAALVREELK